MGKLTDEELDRMISWPLTLTSDDDTDSAFQELKLAREYIAAIETTEFYSLYEHDICAHSTCIAKKAYHAFMGELIDGSA